MLSGLLLSTSLSVRSTAAQTAKDTETNQAFIKVQKIGVGRDSRVEVKLLDSTKVKGYVSKIEADSFNVTDLKSGATQTVPYAQVTQVKKLSGGLSTRTWAIIGGAAVAAIIVGVTVIKPVACDGGAGC
jgi:hypothetical protein